MTTRDDPTAFAPPPTFGPFRVLHQIGVGALGPVFRTYEPARDRLVAVKVFRLDITPEQAKALADELARAAEAGLFHPSVVEPLAAGVEGTVAYRADEYVAAESLDVAMRHYAPATLDKVLPFITQLAGAIDFARAAGVGHGALHPRDIFVTPDEARATGFGVVDALERMGLRAPVRRPYSPPERVAGGLWGTPADVFSLAAIAFELLTARRPAGTGEQIGPLTGAVVSEHADRIRAVLARAMDEDPDRRYPTALGFAAALEAAARGEAEAPASAAVAISAPAVVEPPATEKAAAAVAQPEPDDIAAEREEDEAHWAMAQEEKSAAQDVGGQPELQAKAQDADHKTAVVRDQPVEPSGPAPIAAIETGAPSDSDLRLHAAPADDVRERSTRNDFSLHMVAPPESPAVEPETISLNRPSESPSRPAPVVTPFDSAGLAEARAPARDRASEGWRPASRPPKAPPTVFDTHDALLDHDLSGIESKPPERAPVTMLPLAITLIFGLLLGFGAGYIVGGRSQGQPDAGDSPAGNQTAVRPGEPGPAGTASSPAREFSEQTVAPSVPAAAPPPAVPDRPPDSTASAGPGRSTAPAAGRSSAPSAPQRGRIVVRSTPPGAGVTVNGNWRGRTPLPLDDLAFGKYAIRIIQPGYEAAREEVTLSAAEPSRTLSVRLDKQASAPPPQAKAPAARQPASQTFTGSVFVDSRPRGAKVMLDGKELGTTPLTIPDVPVGSHIIRLELPDHRHWTNSITVRAGQRTPVTGSLEPLR